MTTTRLFAPIVAAFDWLARRSQRMAAMEQLSATTDAELARRGTTRTGELARIFP